LPDLVRWRWLREEKEVPLTRFLAGPKNTFERLWWRAHAYFDPANEGDAYWLVREIGEDESVGMMERTLLSGIRPFVVAVLKGHLSPFAQIKPHSKSCSMLHSFRMRPSPIIYALERID
jgi:hypothetical protein